MCRLQVRNLLSLVVTLEGVGLGEVDVPHGAVVVRHARVFFLRLSAGTRALCIHHVPLKVGDIEEPLHAVGAFCLLLPGLSLLLLPEFRQ